MLLRVAVTFFTLDAGLGLIGTLRRVASQTPIPRWFRQELPSRFLDVRRVGPSMADGDIQSVDWRVKADLTLIQLAAIGVQIRLPDASKSKRPDDRRGESVATIADRIHYPIGFAADLVRVATAHKSHHGAIF